MSITHCLGGFFRLMLGKRTSVHFAVHTIFSVSQCIAIVALDHHITNGKTSGALEQA